MLLSTGTSLGKYRIIEALRSGGMATLYLARRTGAAGFSKPVAIKVVHPDLSEDAEFIDMFVAEAKLAAHVNDANVAHVEELGHEDGVYFIAMEYVLGGSLAQLATALSSEGRALSREVAVRLVADAARGLHAAHEATSERGDRLGIVHRDVSPQNVLVSTKGVVKIVDFGVAKTAARSETRSLRGKIPYMSPEQARGARVDRRTDIYALGVILWELLTSKRLFVATSDMELLELVQRPAVVPPSQCTLRAIPAALDAVVMRALAPGPDGRPLTAEALREELFAAEPGAARVPEAELGDLIEQCLQSKLDRERAFLRDEDENTRVRPLKEPAVIAELIATRTVPAVESTLVYEVPAPRAPVPTELLPTGVIVPRQATLQLPTMPAAAPVAEPVATARVPRTSRHGRLLVLPVVGVLVLAGALFVLIRARAPVPRAQPSTAVMSPPVESIVPTEAVEPTPSVRASTPIASAMPTIATKPARKTHRAAPAPTGSTSIVHGTPLTTDVH